MATQRPQDPNTRPTRGNEVVATATTEPRPVTLRGPRATQAPPLWGALFVLPRLLCSCWTPTNTWQRGPRGWEILSPSHGHIWAPSRVSQTRFSLFGATYGPAVPARPRSPRTAPCLARGCLLGADAWDLEEYEGAWPAPSTLFSGSYCTVPDITYNVVDYV